MHAVMNGTLESCYVTDFKSKSPTMRGRSELRLRGFGPFFDNEDLVSGHMNDDSKHIRAWLLF